MKVQVIGGPFLHSMSTTLNKQIDAFEWSIEEQQTKIFVDAGILQGINGGNTDKYAFISETRAINPEIYEWCVANVFLLKQNFSMVFTHYDELLKLGDVPLTGTWIDNIEMKPKTKLISAISSNKSWLSGHKKRLGFLSKLPINVDLFGRGFREIEKKEEGLNDYMFSIAIENDVYSSYFTEKVLDCFATGTVPIYFGDKSISKFFDERGILFFESSEEMKNIIDNCTQDHYNEMLPYIKNNLQTVKGFDLSELHILKHINDTPS